MLKAVHELALEDAPETLKLTLRSERLTPAMNPRSIHAFLFACVVLLSGAAADVAKLSKAEELTQARDFVSRWGAANRPGKRPFLGVLSHWDLRIHTYSDDPDQQLERSTLYPLYEDCCRTMKKLYGAKPTTYLAEDSMGYPSQMTIVEFDDVDFGKSHLIAGLWEGNDSSGFYFRHLPGAFPLQEGWKKRDSWSLEGIFIDAKKPVEPDGTGPPALRPGLESGDPDQPQPEAEGRSR
jgi:hypothetical protein